MESTYKDDKLRYLFDSFHSTSIMYIAESKKIEWDTRPEEPECGDDVISTVNEGILRFVTEKYSNSLSDESRCPLYTCLFDSDHTVSRTEIGSISAVEVVWQRKRE